MGAVIVGIVARLFENPASIIAVGFVLMSMVSFASAMITLAARDGVGADVTWPRRLTGAGVLIVGVAMMLLI